METNTERFVRMGKAIYGEKWQRPAARAIGVNSSQVWRFTSGKYEPNESHLDKLAAAGKERMKEIAEGIRRIR